MSLSKISEVFWFLYIYIYIYLKNRSSKQKDQEQGWLAIFLKVSFQSQILRVSTHMLKTL